MAGAKASVQLLAVGSQLSHPLSKKQRLPRIEHLDGMISFGENIQGIQGFADR